MKTMPMALILSSHVSASSVGGGVSERVLNRAGVDTMLVPTVLYGRQPGWGAPGGGVVEQPLFQGVIAGITDQGLLDITDVVLTGYFAEVGQVFDAARVIDAVRKGSRQNGPVRAYADEPLIVVDPIMGDAPGGLYVPPAIAAAVKDQLVSRADLVTPNAFELGHVTGRQLTDLASMVRAARALERPALVSSLPRHGRIGVMYVDAGEAWLVTHERFADAPKGTGDVLTAAFVGALVNGAPPKAALEHAVAVTVSVVQRAHEWGSPELPLVAAADVFRQPLIAVQAEAI
ncbi:MAG: PfkB family carbohydrate kinase [Pseudomonadota bacterium]|nr:PfkB family carbohydrate kinase [Pseudomonadota bacterium]